MLRWLTGSHESNQLKAKILGDSSAVVEEYFGLLGGRVFFIKPDDANVHHIEQLINELDQQSAGRATGNAPDWFVGGGGFILQRTDEYAVTNHNLYVQSLKRPADYIGFIKQALTQYLERGDEFCLRELTVEPVRRALAHGMFGIDNLTPDYSNALKAFSSIIQDVNDNFAQAVSLNLIAAYYTFLFNLFPEYVQARQQYIDSIDKFIFSQADVILNDLHRYGAGEKVTNVLSLSVVQLIKEKNSSFANSQNDFNYYLSQLNQTNLLPYLTDPYIRTVPGSIAAGDNTMTILSCGLSAIATNADYLSRLRSAIDAAGITDSSSSEYIEQAIIDDKQHSGFLHQFYLECMRRASLLKNVDESKFGSLTYRHTNTDIQFGDKTIPANSMIVVLRGLPRFDEHKWQNPAEFKPSRFFATDGASIDSEKAKIAQSIFSTGRRMCPANFVTEYIFKTYIAELVLLKDLTLVYDQSKQLDEIKNPSFVRVRLAPRCQQQSMLAI